jgi:ABC-type sugar transport system substrate-binding protein
MKNARKGTLALVLLAASACVAPARSFDAYEAKAADTSDSALSAVETGRLAATTAGRDHSFATTLAVVLADAEKDASGARGIFESIQPPDQRSDELRTQLDSLLDRAVNGLSRLRITVRRGDIASLPSVARPLASVSHDLEAFSNAHS